MIVVFTVVLNDGTLVSDIFSLLMYSISLLPNSFHSEVPSVLRNVRVIVKIEIYSLKCAFHEQSSSVADVATSVAPSIYYFRMRSGRIRIFEFLQPQQYQSSYLDIYLKEKLMRNSYWQYGALVHSINETKLLRVCLVY